MIKNNGLPCFPSKNVELLTTISNTRFTRREIDIMACLLSARGTSKIAALLSISPKTVVNHIQNIMLKVRCNSREGIIDFVEKSNKGFFFSEHYAELALYVLFRKSLLSASKLKQPREVSLKLICGPNHKSQQEWLLFLREHLELAGLIVSIDLQKEGTEFFRFPTIKEHLEKGHLICLPEGKNIGDQVLNPFKKKKLAPIILVTDKSSKSQLDKNVTKNKEVYVELGEEGGYYLFFFAVLKKVFFNDDFIQKLARDFKRQYDYLQSAHPNISFSQVDNAGDRGNSLKEKSDLGNQNPFSFKRKYIFVLLGFFGIIFTKVGWFEQSLRKSRLLFYNYSQGEKITRIKSDLIIPKKRVLLSRSELLKNIEKIFREQKGLYTLAIVGIGGAGKTTLARQYAQQQESNIIWEVNAETQETLLRSFEILAEALSNFEEDKEKLRELKKFQDLPERERKIISYVRERLKSRPGWLLIYDNVENFSHIHKYFPHDVAGWGSGRVLITSRNSNIQNNAPIDSIINVGELSPTQQLTLFWQIISQGSQSSLTNFQRKRLKNFLAEIPPYPLDVSVAAYYLKATNTSYGSYLESLRADKKCFKDFSYIQANILKEGGDYNNTRYSIITLSLQKLLKDYPDFLELVLLVSLLDSHNIPQEVLRRFKNNIIVDSFIYNLKIYSLINTEKILPHLGPVFSIHRSTQSAFSAYLAQFTNLESRSLLQSLTKTLKEYLAEVLDKEDFPKMSLLVRHYESFESNFPFDNMLERIIGGELGRLYYYQNNYEKARKLIEGNLLFLSQLKEKDYDKFYKHILCLGNIYRNLGDYTKAKSLLEKSLEIYKKYLPINHANLLNSLNHLGNIYRIIGDYEKSKQVLEEALFIYEHHLPHSYSDISQTLTNLGSLHRIIGNHKKAIALLERSLGIYKQYLSEQHPGFPWALIQLGSVYRILGNYGKSRELLKQSLQIYNAYFPNSYNNIARNLMHLGNSYRKLGFYKEAQASLKESMDLYNKYFSPSYVENGWSLAQQGILSKELGDYKTASTFLRESLVVLKKNFPSDHIEISWVTAHLGALNGELGHYQEALQLLKNSLVNYQKIFPNTTHVGVPWVLSHLGNVYKDLGEYEKAGRLFKRSLKYYKGLFGKDNVRYAWTLALLSDVLIHLEEFQKAKENLESSLKVLRKNLYKGHLKISWVFLKLGIVYKKLGDYEKAQENFVNCLSILQNYWGLNHFKTAEVLRNMGEVFFLKGDLKNAETCFKKSFLIFKQSNHPNTYKALENLAELKVKQLKTGSNKDGSSRAQATDYLKEALKFVRKQFPESSPHCRRIKRALVILRAS